jgi:hypothetical protein
MLVHTAADDDEQREYGIDNAEEDVPEEGVHGLCS